MLFRHIYFLISSWKFKEVRCAKNPTKYEEIENHKFLSTFLYYVVWCTSCWLKRPPALQPLPDNLAVGARLSSLSPNTDCIGRWCCLRSPTAWLEVSLQLELLVSEAELAEPLLLSAPRKWGFKGAQTSSKSKSKPKKKQISIMKKIKTLQKL